MRTQLVRFSSRYRKAPLRQSCRKSVSLESQQEYEPLQNLGNRRFLQVWPLDQVKPGPPDTGKGGGDAGIEQGKSLKLHMYGHVRRSGIVACDEGCFPGDSCRFIHIERAFSSPTCPNHTK
jgi:hypothetical protein